MQSPHTPVLLQEVLDAFTSLDKGVLIDATLGFGGHSEALLKAHKHLKIIACDQDEDALAFSKQRLAGFLGRINFYKCNFSKLLEQLKGEKITAILADIGVSSLQLDKDERGFSVKSHFLDMRMNQNAKISAFEVVNGYSESELARVFRDYGELKNAKILAQKVVEARKNAPIKSCEMLAKIIGRQKIAGRKGISCDILALQALRIEVNDELKNLQLFLDTIEKMRPKSCVVGIISFHSLESRIVKNYFKKWANPCECPPAALKCTCKKGANLGKIVGKFAPSKAEIAANPRSSSALLRVFKFRGDL